MRAAFTSQLRQNYPEFEVLFGVSDLNDPAATEVRELLAQNPDAPARLIITDAEHPAQNRKVANLIELSQHARYPIWVVNDSDIKVTPDYLRSVVAPLADPAIGLVTCLYRPRPHSIAATWEALGIATDFMPSTLVAPIVGVREFGLGSTLVFRAADLARVGGFEPLADFLADDYQLGRRITSLGLRAVLFVLYRRDFARRYHLGRHLASSNPLVAHCSPQRWPVLLRRFHHTRRTLGRPRTGSSCIPHRRSINRRPNRVGTPHRRSHPPQSRRAPLVLACSALGHLCLLHLGCRTLGS